MKKIIYVTLLATIAISVFYACKKDSGQVPENKSNVPQYTEYEWQVYYKLQDLKQKLNSGERGLDPISLSEAEWYMETNFNVEEARTEEPFKLIYKDSTYYALSLDGLGMVEYSSINVMYNEILSDVDSIEYVISNPEAIPVFAGLKLLSSNNNEAAFMLTIGIGTYYSGNYAPFYSVDDWYFGNNLGRTDGYELYYSDAGKQLTNRLNNPFFQWISGSFLGTPIPKYVLYGDYPDIEGLNPETNVGYLIYYEESTAFPSPVLENEELTFYLNNLHNIIYTYDNQVVPHTTGLGQRPYGYAFRDVTVWTPTGTLVGGGYFYEHRYTAYYAIRVNIPIPD